ncbi:hypothetical protein Tco_1127839, partial [Tanacetum coccineum]
MIRMRDDIPEEDMPLRRIFVLTAPPPGCDVAESSAVAAARPPRGQYDFLDTVEAGHGLICSPGHDARTIARAVDRAEDIGYVRALQASEHRMMTSIKEVNLRLHDARTDHRDNRLEVDVVRGQRTAYEIELGDVRHAYLSSEAQNRALLARLETLETHMSRMEWQRQSIEDLAVRQMMHTQVLKAKAQIDTVENAVIIIISICIDIVIISHVHCILVISRIMSVTRQGANDAMTPESIQAMIDQAIQRNSTHTQDDASQSSGGGVKRPVQPTRMESIFHISGSTVDNQVKFATCTLLGQGNDVAAYTQCFQELALMCTKFLADETEKVDKYISGLSNNIHGNVMSTGPKTLDDTIKFANNLMDQKLG